MSEDASIPRLPSRAKEGEYIPSGPNDLFDNPMVRAAKEKLSQKDIERYQEIGKQLYGQINFEDCQTLNNMPPEMADAVIYLETQLRSGLHPSMMEENEKALLADAYGDEWYTKWGYVKEDLEDMVTF